MNGEKYLVKHRSDRAALELSHSISEKFVILTSRYFSPYNARVYGKTQLEYLLHDRASSSNSPPGLSAAFSFSLTKNNLLLL